MIFHQNLKSLRTTFQFDWSDSTCIVTQMPKLSHLTQTASEVADHGGGGTILSQDQHYGCATSQRKNLQSLRLDAP